MMANKKNSVRITFVLAFLFFILNMTPSIITSPRPLIPMIFASANIKSFREKIVYRTRNNNVILLDYTTNKRVIFDQNIIIWSPDYTKFTSTHNNGKITYIKTLNAKTIREIPGMVTDWSKDGKKLVGLCRFNNGNGVKLFTVNPDGSNVKYLQTIYDSGILVHPKWSPNAQKIAFAGYAGNDIRNSIKPKKNYLDVLSIMDKDGNNAQVIWHNKKQFGSLGSNIGWLDNYRIMAKNSNGAFRNSDSLLIIDSYLKTSKQYGKIQGHYCFSYGNINPKTGQIVAKTDWPYYNTTKLAIFILNLQGLELISVERLETDTYNHDIFSPIWSPDGKKIAYIRNDEDQEKASAKNEIVIIDAFTKKEIWTIKVSDEPVSLFWLP